MTWWFYVVGLFSCCGLAWLEYRVEKLGKQIAGLEERVAAIEAPKDMAAYDFSPTPKEDWRFKCL